MTFYLPITCSQLVYKLFILFYEVLHVLLTTCSPFFCELLMTCSQQLVNSFTILRLGQLSPSLFIGLILLDTFLHILFLSQSYSYYPHSPHIQMCSIPCSLWRSTCRSKPHRTPPPLAPDNRVLVHTQHSCTHNLGQSIWAGENIQCHCGIPRLEQL